MDAYELIKNNELTNIEITGEDQKVVFSPIAISAVNMAHDEMKRKAIYMFRCFLEAYCHDARIYDLLADSEHYIQVFANMLDKKNKKI